MSESLHGAPGAIACAGAARAPACSVCLFGASGDLARRLLIPALYNLAAAKLLDADFELIGISRKPRSDADFADDAERSLRALASDAASEFGARRIDEASLAWLKSKMRHIDGDLDSPAPYSTLAERIGDGNAIFYLALPPALFAPVTERLGAAGLLRERMEQERHEARGWRRLVVEKPFGKDLDSARTLNAELLQHCDESQIYRIDHFLGKETVQNILAMRFANTVFEPIWNRHHVERVCIEVSETLGIEQRGGFYDATGALRDMVPNHLFQLLAMAAMETPDHFSAAALRRERCRLMNAVRVYTLRQAAANGMRAQYTAGVAVGRSLPAYRDAAEVAPHSMTETFVALRLLIDNPRWEGVPFHLTTGKALDERATRITLRFKPFAASLFDQWRNGAVPCNELVFQIQPDEGVSIRLAAKGPGPAFCLQPVHMGFSYADYFHDAPSTGYESLLYDCMTGDLTMFQRAEQIEAAWAAVQPFLDAWQDDLSPLQFYAAGSHGPDTRPLFVAETEPATADVPALLRETPTVERNM